MSKNRSHGEGSGQGAQPAADVGALGRDELVEQRPGLARGQLEAGLFADPGQLRPADPVDRSFRCEDGERRQRRDAGLHQPLGVGAAHPRHDRQVVVVASTLDAHRVPGADAAVVDGVGVGRGRSVRQPVA